MNATTTINEDKVPQNRMAIWENLDSSSDFMWDIEKKIHVSCQM